MRPPAQIWSSQFWYGAHDARRLRDLHRAREEWGGESRIWLDPRAKKTVRWDAVGEELSGLLIPSELINAIDVWHVDGHSRISPRSSLATNGDGSLEGRVYLQWLAQGPNMYYQPVETLRIRFPHVEGDTIVFREENLPIRPGPLTPLIELTEDGFLDIGWTTGREASIVDLDSEMEETTGTPYFTKNDDGLLLAASDNLPGHRALSTTLRWDPPFDDMFPAGGGVDHLHHIALMRDCIDKYGQGEKAEALRESEHWVNAFSGRITSFHLFTWFLPLRDATASQGEQEILFAVDNKHDISANSLEELVNYPRFVEEMKLREEAIWLDGWLGYMWWEIYQDIRDSVGIRPCAHCGNIIRGGQRSRQFCRTNESRTCFRERSAIRQRKRRSTRV